MSATENDVPTCIICKEPAGPDLDGNYYQAQSENGMRMLHFWVCNPCAIPYGVGQGEIDPDLEFEQADN